MAFCLHWHSMEINLSQTKNKFTLRLGTELQTAFYTAWLLCTLQFISELELEEPCICGKKSWVYHYKEWLLLFFWIVQCKIRRVSGLKEWLAAVLPRVPIPCLNACGNSGLCSISEQPCSGAAWGIAQPWSRMSWVLSPRDGSRASTHSGAGKAVAVQLCS